MLCKLHRIYFTWPVKNNNFISLLFSFRGSSCDKLHKTVYRCWEAWMEIKHIVYQYPKSDTTTQTLLEIHNKRTFWLHFYFAAKYEELWSFLKLDENRKSFALSVDNRGTDINRLYIWSEVSNFISVNGTMWEKMDLLFSR